MQLSIHPKYNHQTTVTCACGNTFKTGSTLDAIQADICSACHPFFTGEMKFVDTQGRVEKFKAKQQKAQNVPLSKKKSKKLQDDDLDNQPKTLREMLSQVRKTTKK